MSHRLHRPDLRRFGLHTWPFGAALPPDAYHRTPAMTRFGNRLPGLLSYGGFGLITGEPGTGKSTFLRLLTHDIAQEPDVLVRVLSRPQASLADLYRELGACFDLDLRPHNRWQSAHGLRDRWRTHWQQLQLRPVLLIDEAQEASATILGELRLLASGELDRDVLASIVLAGDGRLLDHLASRALAPLASRIGPRCHLEPRPPEDLAALLRSLLEAAGNPSLMSDEVINACAQHAQGNCRALMHLAGELLEQACADDQCTVIDGATFDQLFADTRTTVRPAAADAAGRSPRGGHRRRRGGTA